MQAAARHEMADKASSRIKSNRAIGTACLILGLDLRRVFSTVIGDVPYLRVMVRGNLLVWCGGTLRRNEWITINAPRHELTQSMWAILFKT